MLRNKKCTGRKKKKNAGNSRVNMKRGRPKGKEGARKELKGIVIQK